MPSTSEPEIMADLTRLLRNFHGHEYSGAIGPQTRFFADLGLASIDAVVLGETLEQHYGRRLPFSTLLAELGQRADRDITIGELTAFLHRSL